MTPDGIAAIKTLQPFYLAGDDSKVHALTMLRELSNTDKHRQLPVVANGLRDPTASFIQPNGITTTEHRDGNLKSGAEFATAPKHVDVKIEGTSLVVARITSDDWDVELPDALDTILSTFRDSVCAALIGHLRPAHSPPP